MREVAFRKSCCVNDSAVVGRERKRKDYCVEVTRRKISACSKEETSRNLSSNSRVLQEMEAWHHGWWAMAGRLLRMFKSGPH